MAKKGAAGSRLVAQYFNNSKVDTELMSPTPSPPSSRWLVSELASQGGGRVGGKRPMCIDFTQEFLHGCVDLDVYTELPDEDARKKRGLIARLNKAMYGLHEAPLIWQRVVRNTMRKLGIRALTTAQCVSYHLARRVTVVAHVDDFLCVASKEELENLLRQLLSLGYECRGGMVGPDRGETREVKNLGRTITWSQDGNRWSGSSKHVEAFLTRVWSAGRAPSAHSKPIEKEQI